MPTIVTHAAVAVTAWRAYARDAPVGVGVWCTVAGLAMLPDADVAGLAVGVAYGDLLGHRGLTHSFTFALAVGAVAARALRRSLPSRSSASLTAACVAIMASHGLLDACTNGGLGVAFLAPFEPTRYFLPWRPIEVSPLRLGGMATRRGITVMLSEARWVWAPCGVVWLAWWRWSRSRSG